MNDGKAMVSLMKKTRVFSTLGADFMQYSRDICGVCEQLDPKNSVKLYKFNKK
jgi:hypothetical protein